MNLKETLENFYLALDEFLLPDNEKSLLTRNLSERCIAHKVAEYLKEKFGDFDVDCEYNRNIDVGKMLHIEKEQLIEIAWDKINEDDSYSVFPDILIHTRETNKNNHVIIEIKKRKGSKKDKDFDFAKLQAFTSDDYKYKLGIYLEFNTEKAADHAAISRIIYFQKGEIIGARDNLAAWE